jgi:hypothetical protein
VKAYRISVCHWSKATCGLEGEGGSVFGRDVNVLGLAVPARDVRRVAGGVSSSETSSSFRFVRLVGCRRC